MKRIYGLMIAIGILAADAHAAERLLFVDFEDQEPGSAPVATKVDGTRGRQQSLVVEDDGGGDAPCGKSGNRSLRLQKQQADDLIPRVTWRFDEVASGTFSFKVRFLQSGDFPNVLLNVFLMADRLEQRGISFTIKQNGIALRDGDNAQTFSHQFDLTVPHQISFRFFDDRTYTIMIDGEPFPDERRFSYRPEADGRNNAVQFAIAWADAAGYQVFIDDILVESDDAP